MTADLQISSASMHQMLTVQITGANTGVRANVRFLYPITINDNIVAVARYAIEALDLYIANTSDIGHIPIENIICIMLPDNQLTFTHCPDANCITCGRALYVAVYYINSWLQLKLTFEQMVAVFLEELLHVAYCIIDETQVKHKVVEIMKYMSPSLDFDRLYNSIGGKVNFD